MYGRVYYNIICLKIDFIYASVQAFMHKIIITSGWDGGNRGSGNMVALSGVMELGSIQSWFPNLGLPDFL